MMSRVDSALFRSKSSFVCGTGIACGETVRRKSLIKKCHSEGKFCLRKWKEPPFWRLLSFMLFRDERITPPVEGLGPKHFK